MLCISLYHFVSTVTGAIRKLRHQRGKVRRPAVRAPAPGESLRRKSWMNLVTYLYDHHKLWLWFSDFFSTDLFCSSRGCWLPSERLADIPRTSWGHVSAIAEDGRFCRSSEVGWPAWLSSYGGFPSHGVPPNIQVMDHDLASWHSHGDLEIPHDLRTHPQKNRVFAGTFLLTRLYMTIPIFKVGVRAILIGVEYSWMRSQVVLREPARSGLKHSTQLLVDD